MEVISSKWSTTAQLSQEEMRRLVGILGTMSVEFNLNIVYDPHCHSRQSRRLTMRCSEATCVHCTLSRAYTLFQRHSRARIRTQDEIAWASVIDLFRDELEFLSFQALFSLLVHRGHFEFSQDLLTIKNISCTLTKVVSFFFFYISLFSLFFYLS